MISFGGLNNANAIATRVYNNNQKQLDKSLQKVATGSKVSDVRDDNSAYIIANTLKNESATWEFRADTLRQTSPIFDLFADFNEEGLSVLIAAQKVLAFAATTAPNSNERQKYFDEWQVLSARAKDLKITQEQLYQYTGGSAGPGYAWTQTGGVNSEWTYSPFANLPFLNDAQIPAIGVDDRAISGVNAVGYTPSVFTVNQDFMGASQALMAQAANEELNSQYSVSRINATTMPYTGGAQKTVEKMEEVANRFQNIIDEARGKMFDTDIEIEQAKLKAAQVKMSLAQNTSALMAQHYHALISGLLGNVLNTQRSVLA